MVKENQRQTSYKVGIFFEKKWTVIVEAFYFLIEFLLLKHENMMLNNMKQSSYQ